MKSIHRQLTLRLCLAAALLLPIGGVSVYFLARQVLITQFDATLAAKADALIAASEVDGKKFEIDLNLRQFAGFDSSFDGDSFEVRRSSNEVIARSPSLANSGHELPPLRKRGDGWSGAIVLPGGAPGRVLIRDFVPADDKRGRFGNLQLLVASDSTALHRTLRTLLFVLLSTGVLGLAASVFLIRGGLRRGLRPLHTLAAEVQNLRIDQPGLRLETAPLPEELRVIGEKLNHLLERVEKSLARERRFSSHAAHELRTPLAELKIMTELMHQWPDEATPERSAEMLGVIGDLEGLLHKLSHLSRSDAGAHPVRRESVDLQASIQRAIERERAASAERGIEFCTLIEPGSFNIDPVLWQTILGNLLGNAVDYAPAHSTVKIEASARSFVISNPAPDLLPSDLDYLFDRFWRKNTARSDRNHSGLGLAIVQTLVELLGGTCRADLSEGNLRITLLWNQSDTLRSPLNPNPE